MKDPEFLTLDQVLSIHARTLEMDGGEDGILKQGALESAIASVQATYGGKFLNEFPFEMAASYIIGLACNHALADGNKRVAAIAGYAFLSANGYELQFSEKEYEDLIMAVAKGEMKKAKLTTALSIKCKKRKSGR